MMNWGNFSVDMANTRRNSEPGETIPKNPIVVVQDIGQLSRNFLREVGSMFWFIAHTFEETIDRLRRGRVPFRAASFFRHTERAGVDSVPMVGLVSFFLGLTMALLTGYQLQRFGTERLRQWESGRCVSLLRRDCLRCFC